MLGAEVLVNILVQLLIGARRFGGVEVATARNVAIWSIEVERARDRLEFLNG
jgi:hypothetical protein